MDSFAWKRDIFSADNTISLTVAKACESDFFWFHRKKNHAECDNIYFYIQLNMSVGGFQLKVMFQWNLRCFKNPSNYFINS